MGNRAQATLQVVVRCQLGQLRGKGREGGKFKPMTSLAGLGMPETQTLGEDKKYKAGNGQGQDGEVEWTIWENESHNQSCSGLGSATGIGTALRRAGLAQAAGVGRRGRERWTWFEILGKFGRDGRDRRTKGCTGVITGLEIHSTHDKGAVGQVCVSRWAMIACCVGVGVYVYVVRVVVC
ncbi:hypothetical protein RRF57_011231 [Xylaria bambusicola]|uniref:Uncharacterized protein n=1 Tax=Xylaria bambusicola TaxID=326684 RepID=A0AAN7V2F2_9PEZI